MENLDSAVFEHLPENCVYSVSVKESSKDGYSVKGEVSEQIFGTVVVLKFAENEHIKRH